MDLTANVTFLMGEWSDEEDEEKKNQAAAVRLARLQILKFRQLLMKPGPWAVLVLLVIIATVPGIILIANRTFKENYRKSEGSSTSPQMYQYQPDGRSNTVPNLGKQAPLTVIEAPNNVSSSRIDMTAPLSSLRSQLAEDSRLKLLLDPQFPFWLSENKPPDNYSMRLQQLLEKKKRPGRLTFPLMKGEKLEATCLHVIGTRFSLGQSTRPFLLRMRLALFEAFPLGSMIMQRRSEPFLWIIYVDEAAPAVVKLYLEESIEKVPNAIVCYLDRRSRKVSLTTGEVEKCIGARLIQNEILSISSSVDLYITTALDSDDSLDRDSIRTIQKAAVQTKEGIMVLLPSKSGVIWRPDTSPHTSGREGGIFEELTYVRDSKIAVGTTVAAPPFLNLTAFSFQKNLVQNVLNEFNDFFLQENNAVSKIALPRVFSDTASPCDPVKCSQVISHESMWLFSRTMATAKSTWSSRGRKRKFDALSKTESTQEILARFAVNEQALRVCNLLNLVDADNLQRERRPIPLA